MSPLRLSAEQRSVVDRIAEGRNVVSISKPGTGKTTVAIEASRSLEGKALHLTYNRSLKEESRERVRSLGLDAQIDVDSYHAAATRLFLGEGEATAPDETLIHAALATSPTHPVRYSLIVVDESQDLTPLYASFLVHLLRHFEIPPVMLIIGDPFQRIFGYRGASLEYMRDPSSHFGSLLSSPSFVELHLTTCWRLTPEMADWINSNLDPRSLRDALPPDWWAENASLVRRWWAGGVKAGKGSLPGSVVFIDEEEAEEAEVDVPQLVHSHMSSFPPDQTAFLARSVVHPPRLLSSIVRRFGDTNWHVTNSSSCWEESSLASEGKIRVSTVHKFKGLERSFTCFVGFDSKWEASGSDPLDAFSLLFVACTRAKEKLVVVKGKCLPYATVRRTVLEERSEERKKRVPDLPSLLQHTSFDAFLSTPSKAGAEGLLSVSVEHAIPSVSSEEMDRSRILPGRRGGVEDVSSVLDSAIVLGATEAERRGSASRRRDSLLADRRTPSSIRDYWREHGEGERAWKPEALFTLVLAERCVSDAYSHQWRQVRSALPLVPCLEKCVSVVSSLLSFASAFFGERFVPFDMNAKRLPWREEWFARKFDSSISLRSHLPHFSASDDARNAILYVVTAPSLPHEVTVLVSTVAAFLSLQEEKPCLALIVVANEGLLYSVRRRCSDFELLYRVSARKVGHAFRAEEAKEARAKWEEGVFF